MNIVLKLSNPFNLEPFYGSPVPVELLDTSEGTLFIRNYSAWKNNFPDSPVFVIDSCIKPVFTALCGNSDTLNIPSENEFTKIFSFSAFSSAFSLPPLTVFAPAFLNPASIDKLCAAIRDYLTTPLAAESFTFFSSPAGESRVCIETQDTIFRGERTGLMSIKKFVPLTSMLLWKEKNPDIKTGPFLNGISVCIMNSTSFKNFLSISGADLSGSYFLLEKCWKEVRLLKKEFSGIIKKLDAVPLEEGIFPMEDKFAVSVDGIAGEIDTPAKLLKTLPLDANGNFINGPVEIEDIHDSLIINKGFSRIILKNLRHKMVLSSEKGTRVESL